MTVKELIEELQKQDPNALVYSMAHDDDIAVCVLEVRADVLSGKDKTIVILY